MSNEVLNSLLREYEQKKLTAELDLEKRKAELYKKLPELQKIDDEINHLSFQNAKNILNKSDSLATSNYKQKLEE